MREAFLALSATYDELGKCGISRDPEKLKLVKPSALVAMLRSLTVLQPLGFKITVAALSDEKNAVHQ